jgi:hypothetical protein
VANAQLEATASKIPVTLENNPTKKYSAQRILLICARDAPSVRSKILSFSR